MFKEINTVDLSGLITAENISVVDIRPVDAYNGWRLEGEKRGGHIKGGRSMPLKWASWIDWIEIVHSKGLKPSEKLVIYGYSEEDALSVASLFEKAGFSDICLYNGFKDEWANDETLPMEKLERYKNLVPAVWVNDLVAGKDPFGEKISNPVICHAHYRNRSDYEKGHIPGAIALDTLELESPETWNRRSPQELSEALSRHGIRHDSTVILYGRFSSPNNSDPFPGSSAGHLGAIRCAAIMMYAGVKDVRVLNGGLQSWQDEGLGLSMNETIPSNGLAFGNDMPQHPELFIDTPDAKRLIASDKGDIVSVRSWPEWIGEVSGYNYIEKKGRIPGALFGNCGSDAYHMENYRNLDHTTREATEIAAIWEEAGITPDRELAFYCGTGWRGSEAFYNAWLMGWPRVAVYDGGWFEWSNDPDNPYETGEPSI